MKKIFLTFCVLIIGLNAQSTQLYPYQVQEVKSINGAIKQIGNSDLITIPSSQPFSLKDSLIDNKSILNNTMMLTSLMMPLTNAPLDPYIIPINGESYVMVQDNNDNQWTKDDLLGINDKKENIFDSLKKINTDKDYNKLTSKELKKANIRLVKINKDNSLLVKNSNQDYDLNKIDYIDMTKLRKTANSDNTGIFGHFNVYLKTDKNQKQMIVGYVTFDTDKKLEVMFE